MILKRSLYSSHLLSIRHRVLPIVVIHLERNDTLSTLDTCVSSSGSRLSFSVTCILGSRGCRIDRIQSKGVSQISQTEASKTLAYVQAVHVLIASNDERTID